MPSPKQNLQSLSQPDLLLVLLRVLRLHVRVILRPVRRWVRRNPAAAMVPASLSIYVVIIAAEILLRDPLDQFAAVAGYAALLGLYGLGAIAAGLLRHVRRPRRFHYV